MSKKVYIFLADGFEDIEGLTVVDLMRRARQFPLRRSGTSPLLTESICRQTLFLKKPIFLMRTCL